MYSQWLETQNQSYRKEALKRLIDCTRTDDFIIAPSQPINIKTAKWKLASDLVVRKDNLEATVYAIERLSLRDKPDQFIPILFVSANKLTKRDKLLITFNSLVLSEAFKHEISLGKFIYGRDFTKSKVKVSLLAREVKKGIGKIVKKYFLRKHLVRVDQFYRILDHTDYQSEVAVKCKERFNRNRDKLFTFLRYDGVLWNNNNAEHAIKAYARLREVVAGSSTEKGIKEYLTLLSICQTCKYSGVDFLDFLRSGEKTLQIL